MAESREHDLFTIRLPEQEAHLRLFGYDRGFRAGFSSLAEP